MAVKNAIYKVDNGTEFDEIHFKTNSEQVVCKDGRTAEESLEDRENKMKTVNVPENTDLAEYFKTVDRVGTFRVVPNIGVINTCVANNLYSFYYVYATYIIGVDASGISYQASFVNKLLGEWHKVGIEKRIDFNLIPKSGYSIEWQECCVIGTRVYITCRFKYNGEIDFPASTGNRELATIPSKYVPSKYGVALATWSSNKGTVGVPGNSSGFALNDGRLLAVNLTGARTITVSGVYLL